MPKRQSVLNLLKKHQKMQLRLLNIEICQNNPEQWVAGDGKDTGGKASCMLFLIPVLSYTDSVDFPTLWGLEES